jgi:fatty acid desaturase
MVMNWQNACLAMAGLIGGGTAVVHGVLTQRLMVRPIEALMASDRRMSDPVRRLVPLLIHFSTIAWLAGGLALIVAACWLGPQARLAVSLCVGGLYLFGALGNLWGTRGRHPGWMLMTAALALIVVGVT